MSFKNTLKHLFPNAYFRHFLKKTDKLFCRVTDVEKYTIDRYRSRFNQTLNIDQPKTFYEKLCFLKLFYNETEPEKFVDKVAVKDYLNELGYSKNIAKSIAVFNSYQSFKKNINTVEKEHAEFVVKLNHTSGHVFFYNNQKWRDKIGKPLPRRYVYSCLKHFLKLNYYHIGFERMYENIKPKILIEEYLPSLNNGGLDEYKFFLNYGKTKMVNVVYGRQKGSLLKEAFTDENLNVFPIRQNQQILEQNEIYKPDCFEQMVEFCRKTASDRPIIRVDLMTDGKDFKFCEFTFYDCGGMNIFYPLEANKTIGNLFDIESIVKKH